MRKNIMRTNLLTYITSKIIILTILCPILILSKQTVIASELGSIAPELQISNWINKGPISIKSSHKKVVLVIEFFSTSCGHCLDTIVLLTDIQNKYRKKGVTIIGITDDDLEDVKKYVKENKIGYIVAKDDNYNTSEKYLDAFDIDSIPHAFVVNKQGRIVWEGHPQDKLDEVLEEIINDQYDLKKAIRITKANKLFSAYFFMVTQTEEFDLAEKIGYRFFDYAKDDASILNQLATEITSNDKIKKRNIKLAYKAITTAYAITGDADPSVLVTYALVLEMMGKTKKARVFRKKAAQLSKGNDKE